MATETLEEGQAFDARAAQFRADGYSDIEAAQAAYNEWPTVAEVLTHLRLYYSDYSIAQDMASVRTLLAPAGWARVSAYARMRRNAPGFRPHMKDSNNHGNIPPEALSELAGGRECEMCGKSLNGKRKAAKFCGKRCTKAAARVSDKGRKGPFVGKGLGTAKVQASDLRLVSDTPGG